MIYVRNLIYMFLALPALVLRVVMRRKRLAGLAQRLGGIPPRLTKGNQQAKRCFWIHGVSVGEVIASFPLAAELRNNFPDWEIFVSTTTPTGYEVAKKKFGENVFYFPLDFSFCVKRALKRIRPDCIILMELEIWPNFIEIAADKNIPVVIVNGRISERSYRGYRRVRFLIKKALLSVAHYCVQNDEYAGRLRALGIPEERVSVSGSMKYDAVRTERDGTAYREWAQLLKVTGGEKVIVAGSTHPGEEQALFEAYNTIKAESQKGVRIIVAPRHPERWDEVEQLAKKMNIDIVRKTRINEGSVRPEAILLDVMGELSRVYNIADIVFVGGSLIPHGGQNMIEPAGLGKAVVFGPHTFNFASTVAELKASEAAVEIQGPEELMPTLKALIEDNTRRKKIGAAAQKVVAAQKGATARTVEIIKKMIAQTNK